MARRVKRKYTKLNTDYWAEVSKQRKAAWETSHLKEYKEHMAEAEKIGDVGYKNYLKWFYKSTKYERKHKVKIGEGLRSFDYEEYLDNIANEGRGDIGLVQEQFESKFNLIKVKPAKAIQSVLKSKGINLTVQQIRAGQLGKDTSWSLIDSLYQDFIHGTNISGYNTFDAEGNFNTEGKSLALKGTDAGRKLSQFFFGSD